MAQKTLGRRSQWWVKVVGVSAIVLLYLPLASIVVESFFDEVGEETHFAGLMWYEKVFSNHSLLDPLLISAGVGAVSSLIAVALGCAAALSLVRGRFPGRDLLYGVFIAPLIMPELVLGISSLVLFVTVGLPLGPLAMTIAHGTFCFAYALVLIRNRLETFDMRLEEAALDLGASPLQVMIKITLPLCLPGLIAAWLTAFAMSFDDFLVSFFTAGVGSDTLPMKLYSLVKFGMNPQTYALSSIILGVTILFLLASLWLQGRDQPAGGR